MRALLFLLFLFNTFAISYGQVRIADQVGDQCKGQEISFEGMTLKYPLKVKEAVERYGLSYMPSGVFYKRIHKDPPSQYFPNRDFILQLPWDVESRFADAQPADNYLDKTVKGYIFIYSGKMSKDSLMQSWERQFSSKFVKRPKSEASPRKGEDQAPFYDMKINNCTRFIFRKIYSEYVQPDEQISILWICFDLLPGEERYVGI